MSGGTDNVERTRSSRRVATALLALLLGAVALTACLPPPPPTTLEIGAPGLFPNFDVSVTDYVARCGDGNPATITSNAPTGMYVSVAYGAWTGGSTSWTVTRGEGETFTIDTWVPPAAPVTHVVRCLPPDFPAWTFTRTGNTAQEFTIVRPLAGFTPSYPIIFDRNGLPVWWGPKQTSFYSSLLANGNIVSVLNSGLEERTLGGSLVRNVPVSGGVTDGHDFLLLPNGHYVLVANATRTGVDLSAYGGPADTSVIDQTIEEIDPADNSVVWSWNAYDHLGVGQMDAQWIAEVINGGTAPYDVFHWNSIDDTGTGYVLSFRHLDAILAIDRATGDILWKLGGSTTPASLTVANDPAFTGGSHFGGQHDARVNGDGTVSLYDNGSNLGRAPRAVRYSIDTGTKTATLVETVGDPGVTASFCCGSARKVAAGDWLIGFGGTDTAVEIVNGTRRVGVTFPGLILYRYLPVPAGLVTTASLRAAMDARASGASTAEAVDPGTPLPWPP